MAGDIASTSVSQPEHSEVYLEYEPSFALNNALREFVRPSMRTKRPYGKIALRSELCFQPPLVKGGKILEHPPRVTRYLADYTNQLETILPTTQIEVASTVSITQTNNRYVSIGLELLPNDVTTSRLGKLAVGATPIKAFAHIPLDAVTYEYEQATHNLEALLGMHHPSRRFNPHGIPAPRSHGLWVQNAVLRDRLVARNPDMGVASESM